MNYKELTAPQLVKEWRKVVNTYVMMGRDAHLIKDALLLYTPVQLLLGMYQYKQNATISIPQFLRLRESWLVEDETIAEIELAACIANQKPESYYIWKDYAEPDSAYDFQQSLAARIELRQWADRILT